MTALDDAYAELSHIGIQRAELYANGTEGDDDAV